MRIDGALTKWNDDRGFGFIAPAQGGPEVFVHVSSFPKDGQRPSLNERISFEIAADANGKKRAINLVCLDRQVRHVVRQYPPPPQGRQQHTYRREKQSVIWRFVLPIVVLAVGVYGYVEYSQRQRVEAIFDVAAQSIDETANAVSLDNLNRQRVEAIADVAVPPIEETSKAVILDNSNRRRVEPISDAAAQPVERIPTTVFRCDGRQYCSQMTSCGEAKFFLKNCPNVKMDNNLNTGRGNGVPCERQWCN